MNTTPVAKPQRFAPLLTLALVLLLGLVMSLLTACAPAEPAEAAAADTSAAEDVPDGLVIIAGAHAGMPAAGIPAELKDLVLGTIAEGAPVTVITGDGTPEVSFRATDYEIDDINPETLANSIDKIATQVVGAVQHGTADSDGNDLGAAIAIAADQLNADEATRGAVIIIDNGLSDTGFPILTTPGLIDTDSSEAVVAFAQEHSYLPKLPEGTTVTLVGFGYVAEPQGELTPQQRENVVRTWEALFTAAGTNVVVITVPRSGEGPDTTFTTQLVEPGTYEEIVVHRTAGRVEATLPADVLFDSGSGQLRSDDRTQQALTELKDLIQATPGTVTITGYTDSVGSDSDNLALGQSRADAVGAWLTAAGIPADRMRIVSKGESDPAVPNAETPEELQQNRRVTAVIDAESR